MAKAHGIAASSAASCVAATRSSSMASSIGIGINQRVAAKIKGNQRKSAASSISRKMK